MLGAMSEFFSKNTVYDSEGRKWQPSGIQSPYKPTWWRRLLANTFHNPFITVTVLWRESRSYELDELKLAYSKAVDKDDDSLTQFVEGQELKARISATRSFADLVEVYTWMGTEPENESHC